MAECPKCGSHDVHHSRLRTWRERVRRALTGSAPFRCHSCNWRDWRRDAGARQPGHPIRRIHHDLTDAELERLDPDRK